MCFGDLPWKELPALPQVPLCPCSSSVLCHPSPHRFYLITPLPGLFLLFPASPLHPWPDTFMMGWAAMAKTPRPGFPSAKFCHPAPLSCRCCDTTCSHTSKTLSTTILQTILFQRNDHKNKGDWKSTVVWAGLFFWESQVSKLVNSQLLKPFPCFAIPLYIQTFSLCSSSGQVSKSFFSFLKQQQKLLHLKKHLTHGVLLPWGSSFGTGTPLICALHIPFSLLFPPLPKCSSRFPPWASLPTLEGSSDSPDGNISLTFPRPWPHHTCL